MRPTPSRRRPRATTAAAKSRPLVAALEPRHLFAGVTLASQVTVVTPIPSVRADTATPANNAIILAGNGTTDHPTYITDPIAPGTLATLGTSKGNIVVALTDAATPATVANFLSYVSNGTYTDTIFDRSAVLDGTTDTQGTAATGSSPASIIQAGGYKLSGAGVVPVTAAPAVASEAGNTGALGNLQYTIAATLTPNAVTGAGTPGTATADFVFNNADNSGVRDGVYTAFGHVLYGADILTAIGSLPTSTAVTGLDNVPVPVTGLTASQVAGGLAVQPDNLVYLYGVSTQPGLTYTATSSLPALVTPRVDNTTGTLNFTYGTAGATGTATVTVTATSVYDGTTATTSFLVTVPPASSSATAPITLPDTVAAAVTGTATVIHPLANDTDATSTLNPASVTVTTAPANGTATVDPATGDITYTANAGYHGDDTLQYTVANAAGAVSAATAVDVHVVLAPTMVTVGAGTKVRQILFTQPDGTRGRLVVSGASAVVTFSAGDTDMAARGGTVTVTGAGATIADVVATNVRTFPNVTVATIGKGAVTLGGFTDTGSVGVFNAARATVTGPVTMQGAHTFLVGQATHATMYVGGAAGNVAMRIGTAVDSSLGSVAIQSLTSRSWTIDDGGAYAVTAGAIVNLNVSGLFADGLSLSNSGGYALLRATVGGAAGAWQVSGAIFKATVAKPTSAWSLSTGSLLRTLTVRGDLQSAITASAIDTLTVTGAMTNATVETNGSFNQLGTQINRLAVGGAMTGSVVFAAGSINRFSARSMSASRVYAGVNTSVAQASGLPAATTDLTAEATIKSFTLTAGRATFANSELAAYDLPRVRLGTVTAANAGTAFGVAAHTLGVLSLNLDPGGPLTLTGAPVANAATLATYLSRRKITLSDFKVTLFG